MKECEPSSLRRDRINVFSSARHERLIVAWWRSELSDPRVECVRERIMATLIPI